MKNISFNKKILSLAERLNNPLYVVGGFVRNYLINQSVSKDVDLSSATLVEDLIPMLLDLGLTVVAEYKRTGTIVFSDGKTKYEYTSFRKDYYSGGGVHSPSKVEFTDDINEDAKRRDFKCNAVYYDIKKDKIVDPLGGIEDIKNRVLDTVKDAKEVFSHDGLRLMRLARFAGELNFTPTKKVLLAAKENAQNITEISVERIYAELKMILLSDQKYEFSDKKGHYTGLKILDKTGVLDYIIPELTKGRGMVQRSDFHDHDVLEHSLRCVLYAPPKVRLSALLHDVGKPFCMERDGKYHLHAIEGVNLVKEILNRLKVDTKTQRQVLYLVGAHMLDLKGDMKESKIRLHIANNYEYFEDLKDIKQADYSACKDNLSVCPTIERWHKIYQEMKTLGVPFTIKDLAVSATDLIELGFTGEEIGKTLKWLLNQAVINPKLNKKDKLIRLALKDKY